MKLPDFGDKINHYVSNLPKHAENIIYGTVVAINGLCLEVKGLNCVIGDLCCVLNADKQKIYAEVVGFQQDVTILVADQDLQGIGNNAQIKLIGQNNAPISHELIGRVIDWQGSPLDGKSAVTHTEKLPVIQQINVLKRKPITQILDVGVRTINALCTVGVGQRLGLFAGSGVGKSVLLGMMTKYATADVVVVGLIGERTREVQEFIQQILGQEGLKRAVVIAVPGDCGALHKINGTEYCAKIAEYFRECGLNVLLLIDSLTRYAQALREVGIAAGELPIAQGFVPSVFAKLPKLLERAGNSQNSGSITAIYTVLVEGDDLTEPLSDCVRGIVDGHIVLSRNLANNGHFPAIDINSSLSRVMPQLVDNEHYEASGVLRRLWACYQNNQDLLKIGAYQAGTDNLLDIAIVKYEQMRDFLMQNANFGSDFASSYHNLKQVIAN